MKKIFAELNNAIFGYGSPLPMCVFRILVGTLALIDLLMLTATFGDFFTEKGLYPVWMSERYTEGIARIDLLAGVTDPTVTRVIFALAMLSALLVAVGLFTRVSSIALYLLVLTIHHRSGDILNSGDWLLRLWIFSVAVAPAGAMLSLDAWISRRKGVEVVPEVSLWPQRLVQIQLAIVYLTTVWQKWGGELWRNGTATYYTQHLGEFERFPIPGFMDNMLMVRLSTYGTLIVELSLATLVFYRPARNWVLLAGVAMHLYIDYSMNIPLFQYVILSGFIAHFTGPELRKFLAKLKIKAPPVSSEVADAA